MGVEKPKKPYPDYPLVAHSCGRWVKKIDGKTVYFAKWDQPELALRQYLELVTPAVEKLGTSAKDAFNAYLTARKADVTNGTLSGRTFADYTRTLTRLAGFIGSDRVIESLTADDFAKYKNSFAGTNNLVTVGNEIIRVRAVFNWLNQAKKVPIPDYGPDFVKPSEKAKRKYRRERGEMLFTTTEIKLLLDESGIRMKCWILLGINCGYHNSDIETLPLNELDAAIRTGIIEHARAKTEVDRACPLWPETVEALKEYHRRRPKTESNLAFVLPNGRELSATNHDIAKRFRGVRESAMIERGGFSWLRKTFATYASESCDQVAVNFIMGHVDSSTPGIYRQLIRDRRLEKVVEVVREWLFG